MAWFFYMRPFMDRLDDKPSGLKTTQMDGIEIRLWETYLFRSRKNISNILASYSFDNGPFIHHGSGMSRVSFRFSLYDWRKTLIHIFSSDHIPFEVAGTFSADFKVQPRKKKVCIAEPDLNTLFALNTVLEDAGYDVWLSHCNLPMMESFLPATDVFVLDDIAPGIDAIEICRHLRKQTLTRDVPVIVMSEGKNGKHHAMDAGATDCLLKPFNMRELVTLVEKHTYPAIQKSPSLH